MAAKPVVLRPKLAPTNEVSEKNNKGLEHTIVFWGKEAYRLATSSSQSSPQN